MQLWGDLWIFRHLDKNTTIAIVPCGPGTTWLEARAPTPPWAARAACSCASGRRTAPCSSTWGGRGSRSCGTPSPSSPAPGWAGCTTAPPAPPCWKSVIGQKILNNSELSCPYKCSRVYCCCRYILNDSEFFFDRSPRHFESILNLYRTGQLHLMEGVCVEAFSEELAYWGLGRYTE